VGVPVDAPTLRLRHSLGGGFEGALRLLPPPMRAPLARKLLRSVPHGLRLSLAGRAIPALRPQDDLPIVAGPLEGWRWIAASSMHACVEGTYESENQALLVEHVRPGDVVYDVGANAGYFTLLASHLVGPTGRVVAFEPFPAALRYLRRHIELNGVENATVIDSAVSDARGTAHFRAHAEITMGRLADGGELSVDVVRLDDVYANGHAPLPDLIKIDVEGEELKVLRGATAILHHRRPTILLATHGSATHRACCRFLVQRGYKLEQLPYDTTVPEFDFLGEVAAIPA
jgi:FkbM family methyltransferase